MKIYTKTGDKGETSLFTGQRVPKNDPFIEALGAVDECNSFLGAALSAFPQTPDMHQVRDQIETIQHALFDVGAAIATPRSTANNSKIEKTRFDEEEIKIIESWIDAMESKLPPLHAFILPGGHSSGALLHIARSVCRRAERRVLPLYRNADVSDTVLIYLNRLSDYLFSVSRYVNFLTSTPETQWIPHKHAPSH
ncbi:MAG: cob(I)yrinic acid a,c-diamide adenosyltransferase [Parachlamydiaceae bacterium]